MKTTAIRIIWNTPRYITILLQGLKCSRDKTSQIAKEEDSQGPKYEKCTQLIGTWNCEKC